MCLFYSRGSALRSLYSEPLHLFLDQQNHLLLVFLVDFLHFFHEANVVIAVFLEKQSLNDVDQMLEYLINNMFQGQLGAWGEGRCYELFFGHFAEGFRALGPGGRWRSVHIY